MYRPALHTHIYMYNRHAPYPLYPDLTIDPTPVTDQARDSISSLRQFERQDSTSKGFVSMYDVHSATTAACMYKL